MASFASVALLRSSGRTGPCRGWGSARGAGRVKSTGGGRAVSPTKGVASAQDDDDDDDDDFSVDWQMKLNKIKCVAQVANSCTIKRIHAALALSPSLSL